MLFKNTLVALLGPLHPCRFSNQLNFFLKNWNFDLHFCGIYTILWGQLPSYKYWVFQSMNIVYPLIQVFSFSEHCFIVLSAKFCMTSIKFITKYFVWCYWKWCFLFSSYLLLVYGNKIGLCVLIVGLADLLKSFTRSCTHFVESLKFSL